MTPRRPMSRALEQEVAEKVMGWRDCEPMAYTPNGQQLCGTPPEGVKPMFNTGRSIAPAYTTDPAAMLQVIERMREQGFYVSITCLPRSTTWAVQFDHDPENENMVTQGANSLGEAICRAALHAVEAGG